MFGRQPHRVYPRGVLLYNVERSAWETVHPSVLLQWQFEDRRQMASWLTHALTSLLAAVTTIWAFATVVGFFLTLYGRDTTTVTWLMGLGAYIYGWGGRPWFPVIIWILKHQGMVFKTIKIIYLHRHKRKCFYLLPDVSRNCVYRLWVTGVHSYRTATPAGGYLTQQLLYITPDLHLRPWHKSRCGTKVWCTILQAFFMVKFISFQHKQPIFSATFCVQTT